MEINHNEVEGIINNLEQINKKIEDISNTSHELNIEEVILMWGLAEVCGRLSNNFSTLVQLLNKN